MGKQFQPTFLSIIYFHHILILFSCNTPSNNKIGSMSYPAEIMSYTLKPDERKLHVNGQLYPDCPEDSCTVVLQRHALLIQSNYLQWSPKGYVLIHYRDNENNRRLKTLSKYLWENIENRSIPPRMVLNHQVSRNL